MVYGLIELRLYIKESIIYYIIKVVEDRVTSKIKIAFKAKRIEAFSWFWKVGNGSAGGEQIQGYLGGGLIIWSVQF